MDFYESAGPMALGSRLRRLGETLAESASKVYSLYQVPLDPKWFPVFYALSHTDRLSTTEIARTIVDAKATLEKIREQVQNIE